MKQAATALFLFLLVTSCQRSNDDLPGDVNQVAGSNWRVTLFTDSGNNETSDFSGYSFDFQTGGLLIVTKAGVSKNGTWSADNSSNKLIINLGPKDATNKPLGELTDDWKVISQTAAAIKLTDDNASSQEFLTFTKN